MVLSCTGMGMSILFLDIDGVLNGHNGLIDKHCMANLNYIIDETDCFVVISSSWRYMIPDAMTIKGFEYMLMTHGFKGHIIGITDRDEVIPRREQQIEAYPKDDRWAVVDDLPLQIENFVRTDAMVGLQHHDAVKLIQILNFPRDSVSPVSVNSLIDEEQIEKDIQWLLLRKQYQIVHSMVLLLPVIIIINLWFYFSRR